MIPSVRINCYLFDWGNTLMRDIPGMEGPMYTWSMVELMPGAEDVLRVLSGKASLYIATNARDSTRIDIVHALERAGIHHYITDIFCFRETGNMKPSPEFFDEIMKRIPFSIKQILFIGDDPEIDIAGAEEYGLKAVLYDPGDKYVNLPYNRIKHLSELLED